MNLFDRPLLHPPAFEYRALGVLIAVGYLCLPLLGTKWLIPTPLTNLSIGLHPFLVSLWGGWLVLSTREQVFTLQIVVISSCYLDFSKEIVFMNCPDCGSREKNITVFI